MNVPFDWNKYDDDVKQKILKDTKSGSISFIKDKDELNKWEIYHAHWKTYLTSDYWKNWQEKINSFQTVKEVNFYTDRLRAFIDFIKEYTRKDILYIENAKPWDPINTPTLIEQELKRLENISEEEFNKTDEWRKSGSVFKELSAEEMLNDPWFNKEIDKFFGLEDGKLPKNKNKPVEKDSDSNIDYKNWTREQLISEINHLKAENEELKNNQTLTSSERQERLQKNQQKLEQLGGIVEVNNNELKPKSNDFPTGWVIGGSVLVLVGLVAVAVIRKSRKKKNVYKI